MNLQRSIFAFIWDSAFLCDCVIRRAGEDRLRSKRGFYPVRSRSATAKMMTTDTTTVKVDCMILAANSDVRPTLSVLREHQRPFVRTKGEINYEDWFC
jgi:hypothetical protein